ncbi:glycoside hydrolase family 26 protein [Frankia sp. Cj3]|uniref:glycoside hydrolase family 26 protein n=1 Tax=Frankia sp. Cj3 TaxID=2880976 RepID=UPI001EF5957A|nr:glycosyl hydrolase [Frankia sp. Cj3]
MRRLGRQRVGAAGPARSGPRRARWGRRLLPGTGIVIAVLLALIAWRLTPVGANQTGAGPPAPPLVPGGGMDGIPTVVATAMATADASVGAAAVGGETAAAGITRVAPASHAGRFPSGVAAGTLAEADAWAGFRGRPNDVVVTYTDRSGWRTIVRPWIGNDRAHFAGFSGTWVISQPLFPESGPDRGNLADCAAGGYDGYWRDFGRWLVAEGRGSSFVRLGWEFNGTRFAWSASNPALWIRCYRNAAAAIRRADPRVRLDWNFGTHGSVGTVDAFELYPGDAYVDVIGIDIYDQYPPSVDSATFDAQCDGLDGLCRAIRFARLHNKLFSVPAWGVVAKEGSKAGALGQAGGDNTLFVAKMHELFVSNADILAYEAYSNEDRAGDVRSALINPTMSPLAAREYQRLW